MEDTRYGRQRDEAKMRWDDLSHGAKKERSRASRLWRGETEWEQTPSTTGRPDRDKWDEQSSTDCKKSRQNATGGCVAKARIQDKDCAASPCRVALRDHSVGYLEGGAARPVYRKICLYASHCPDARTGELEGLHRAGGYQPMYSYIYRAVPSTIHSRSHVFVRDISFLIRR